MGETARASAAAPGRTTCITRSRVGVLTYLAPPGTLADAEARAALATAFEACIGSRELQVALDLAGVPTLDSACLELLLDTQDRLTRIGGWLQVANPSPLLQEVFSITGVGECIAAVHSAPGEAPRAPPTPPRGRGAKPARRLGDLLVARGLLTPERLAEALRLQGQAGRRVGQIVVERGWVAERDFLAALSEQLGIPCARPRPGLYDPAAVATLPREVARRLRVLPLFRVRGSLTLATADPQSLPSLEEVEGLTGCKVRPVLAEREDILRSIEEAYVPGDSPLEYSEEVAGDFHVMEHRAPEDYTAIDEMAAGSPVINLINSLIQRAVRDGASDVHIEPSRTRCRVRFRIDGVLYEVLTPRLETHPALVSRLKVMAGLDIAERRLPQDGRIQVFTQGRTVDLRFSSLPGIFGEKVVLRVLDKDQSILDLAKLGMAPAILQAYRDLLAQSYGLVLVTGPTGSGKTTTLYAGINHLNSLEKNIVTIEDPVEYQLDVVNQNQVKEAIGLTFARMLKHVLRQDPDIVMVGEIRERETAQIAVQAALTGHLVLSTLHTNDSVGAVSRMLDMGVEPYLLNSALIGVVAQRLVRRVCPECQVSYVAPPALAERLGWKDAGGVRLVKGRGCAACYDSGYKGRLGIHEILVTDPEFQRLMLAHPTRDQLARHLADRGTRTLFDDGIEKARAGLTTVEEVSRVVNVA